MTQPTETAAHDLLLQLAPPVRLVGWLEATFAQRRAKGDEIPAEYCKWLERWQRIRSDQPSETVDYITAEEWAALGERVSE